MEMPRIPEWVCTTFLWLAVIGIGTVVIAVVVGVWWAGSHLSWTQ